ncbi:MAG: hypothetical protein JXR64_10200 [Spirochaetales bacterium]|nr:hypothetical protein [Spirochaetales bacterium]
MFQGKIQTLCIIILLIFTSCSQNNNYGKLIKEDKFTLPIGNMDNELDFFAREDVPFSLTSDIFMSKGIFLISNGNGKKIMKFNSYGDLLEKISPDKNSDISNPDFTQWSFNKPGNISSTENYIYITDTLDYESALTDQYIDKSYDTSKDKSNKEKHILNEQIVTVFDIDGKYINYIGQEGLGGTPFPYIKNIYSDINNRLIVVTQTTYFWIIFRYTEEGTLIGKSIIEIEYLPQLENEENTTTQINNIIPDRNKNRLLIDLTFYKKIYDEKTDDIISIDTIKSRIYYFDLNEGKYISWMDVPEVKKDDEQLSRYYVLIDVVFGKYIFFKSSSIDGISEYLTITNENGYIIGDYDLNIDNSNIIYSNFYVSNTEGILTALLCTEYAGGITQWRTDKILNEDMQ